MNTRFKLVRTLLILGLVVCVGRLFFLKTGKDWLQASMASSETVNQVLPSSPESIWPRYVRTQNLLESPLFKSFQSTNNNNAQRLETRSAENFGYELIGTLVTSRALSQAIFRNVQTQETVICKQNETLDHATVTQIYKDHVVLQDRDGDRFILEQSRYENAVFVDKGNINSDSVVLPTEIAKRSYPGEQFYNGFELFMKKATLAPVETHGQVIGLKVSGLDEIPFAQLAGLQNDDVIVRINAQAITSRQKAFQVFKKSKSMAHMDIELLRNNKTKTLSFELP